MSRTRTFYHVWELILELDAWMQHSITTGIESGTDTSKQTAAFEDARNIIAEHFPMAKDGFEDRKAYGLEVVK